MPTNITYNAVNNGRSNMIKRVLKFVLEMVASFLVFLVMVLALTSIAGKIFGTTKFADGTEKLHGGGATTVTLLVLSFTVTIAFCIWFHKFLKNYKVVKAKS